MNHNRNIAIGDRGGKALMERLGHNDHSFKTSKRFAKKRFKKLVKTIGAGDKLATLEKVRQMRRERMLQDGFIISPRAID